MEQRYKLKQFGLHRHNEREMASKRIERSALQPSSLTKLIESTSASQNAFAATAIQILHNLQHQHFWTSLQIHDLETESNATGSHPLHPSSPSHDNIPILISGIPPHRVYTHPDEQLYMLEQGLREDDLKPERLFVIPAAQGQKWSLRRMANAFDVMLKIEVTDEDGSASENVDAVMAKKLDEYYRRREKASLTKEWGSQRALLAMVDRGNGGEGTVVYYVVQEGEVKPRQN